MATFYATHADNELAKRAMRHRERLELTAEQIERLVQIQDAYTFAVPVLSLPHVDVLLACIFKMSDAGIDYRVR